MPVIDFSAQSELYVLGLLAGVGSFLLSWMLTPLSINLHGIWLLDYPSERKVHQDATPRVGGLAVVLAFTLGELLFWHAAPLWATVYSSQWCCFSLPCSSMINMTFLLGEVFGPSRMLGCCGIHGCEDRCSHFVGGRYAVFPDWLSIAISVLWLVLLSML